MNPQQDPRFRAMIENALDVITIVDVTGRIVYESPSIERLSGYTAEELAGRKMFERSHPDDVDEAQQVFKDLVAHPGAIVVLQTRIQHRDGSWIHIESRGTNLLDNPDIQGIVINTRDITSRKVAEDKLHERTQELEQLNRFMVGRELRMIELKKQVATLRKEIAGLQRERMGGPPSTKPLPDE